MKKPSFLKSRTPQLVPLFALLAMTINVHADSATWNGVDATWATLGNWSGPPVAVPGAADTATFSSAGTFNGTSVAPINSGGTVNVNSIVFDSVSFDYFIGGTINLSAGGAITASNGNQTFVPAPVGTPSVFTAGSASITNNGLGLLSLGVSSNNAGSTLAFGGTGLITTTSSLATTGNTTAVVKNDSGTLTLGNFSNTNIQGGFTINGGTVIALNGNSLSNRNLTLASGTTVQMNASGAASAFGNTLGTGVTVNGDTTLFYNVNTSQWRIGQTSGQGFMNSTNTPTVTFKSVAGSGNVQLYLNNSGFNGTWKLGDEGVVALNHINSTNGATVRMNMGDSASTGRHILQTGAILAVEGATQNIVPVQLGELSGTNTSSILAGRVNLGTRTTGTQYRVGGLNSNSSYAGTITDAVSTSGVVVTNGTAAAGTQTNGVAGVQGTTEFVKTGSGVLTLTGTNTHTGGTVIQGGVVAVNSDAALGATYTGALRPFSVIPGTAAYNGVTGVLPSLSLSGGNPVTAATVGLFSSDNSRSNASLYVSFGTATNSSLSGSGYISVPNVVFSGGTQSTAGTAPIASVRVQGLVTLDGGTLQTDAGITSNRAIVIGTGGGTISTQGFNSTFSGNVNGSGNLSLAGGGTVSLTSVTNSLTGTATVGANTTLALAGALAGSVQVDSTGTIKGPGNVAGNLAVAASGTLSPGNGLGNLTAGNGLNLGGNYTWELGALSTANPGTDFDTVTVTGGNVTITGAVLQLSLGAFAPSAASFWQTDQTWNAIINDTGAGSLTGAFAAIDNSAWSSLGAFSTTNTDNDVNLVWTTAVPEPATGATLGLAGMLMLLYRRRATRN